jgi:hypothetical protein
MEPTPNQLHRQEIEAKIFALAVIQAVGVGVPLLMHLIAHLDVYSMSKGADYFVIGYLFFLVSLAGIVGFLSQPCQDAFSIAFKSGIGRLFPDVSDPMTRLRTITHIFATADLVGISFCICLTGGSETSFFAPFLFTITPILVLLDLLSGPTVLCYAGLSVFIYGCGLKETVRTFMIHGAGYTVLAPRGHKIYMMIATGWCFLLPLIFDSLKRRREGGRQSQAESVQK